MSGTSILSKNVIANLAGWGAWLGKPSHSTRLPRKRRACSRVSDVSKKRESSRYYRDATSGTRPRLRDRSDASRPQVTGANEPLSRVIIRIVDVEQQLDAGTS